MKIAQPVEVDLELPEGARLLMGELKTFGGQLAGHDHRSALTIWSADVTDNRLKVEWGGCRAVRNNGQLDCATRPRRCRARQWSRQPLEIVCVRTIS